MTRTLQHTAAMLAAILITAATIVPVVTVPPVQVASAAAPALA